MPKTNNKKSNKSSKKASNKSSKKESSKNNKNNKTYKNNKNTSKKATSGKVTKNNKTSKQKGGFQETSEERPCERPNAVRRCSVEKNELKEFEGAPTFPPPALNECIIS